MLANQGKFMKTQVAEHRANLARQSFPYLRHFCCYIASVFKVNAFSVILLHLLNYNDDRNL